MSYQPFDLTGKTVIVTGGNSGIGLGMAEALARAGANVCIWGTSETKNKDAEKLLKTIGTANSAMRCDVGDRDDVRMCFEDAVKTYGRIDACFANAGVGGEGKPFHESEPEDWERVFRVNLHGVLYTFQEAVRHMMDHEEGGSLVVTSSDSAVFGAPRSLAYSASKSAVLSVIRGLAVGYARHGIRANAIIPGWIDTPMTERFINSEPFVDRILKRIPIRRWGDGADFGGLAVYLASDASSYHTGDVMIIDGGYAIF